MGGRWKRQRHRVPTKEERQAILAAYLEIGNYERVATAFGLTASRVRYVLVDAGIPIGQRLGRAARLALKEG